MASASGDGRSIADQWLLIPRPIHSQHYDHSGRISWLDTCTLYTPETLNPRRVAEG
jgi:hypothetical protein